ncbi:hypothetical protein MRO49_25290, partial [Escherichia coli]|uniref:hypothetical protein n=1 Tax=Escherichia coli TaxID=562 RepID=UPI002115A61A
MLDRRLAVLALALADLPAAAQTAPPARALQCERLFDARAGKVLGAHTVVVRDGYVAEVLPGRAEVPGASAIDLSGHT